MQHITSLDAFSTVEGCEIRTDEPSQISRVQIASHEVGDTGAVWITGDGGRAVQFPLVRGLSRISGKHFRVGAFHIHVVLPQAGHGTFHTATQLDFEGLAFRLASKNIEFFAANAKHLAKQTITGTRISAKPGMEMLIKQTRGITDDHPTTGSRKIGKPLRIGRAQQQHTRQHHRGIHAPVVFERHHIGPLPRVQKRAIPVTYVMPMVELLTRQGLATGGPFGFGAEENRHVRALKRASRHA